jgi:type IV pilus assembly protein PilO
MKLNQPVRLPELNQRNAMLAVVGVAVVFNVYLLVRLIIALFTAHSMTPDEANMRQLQLKAQAMQLAPMQGLDHKLAKATADADKFYADRLPDTYSSIAAELGTLQRQTGVVQSRITYSPKAVGGGLTEVLMESSLSGDYPALMRYINDMERDKLFFVIRGVQLNGQQGGQVNLRLRSDTYLRPGTAAANAAAVDAANGNAIPPATSDAAETPAANPSAPTSTPTSTPTATPAATPTRPGRAQ